jgi:dihydroxyacetone kinase-like protein
MNSRFNTSSGQVIIERIITVIHENRDYLSEIDGAIGDGDHGINMDKGFGKAKDVLDGLKLGLGEAMKTLGRVLVDEIGGSMGPLYGAFFRRMARTVSENSFIDAEVLEMMLSSAYEGVQDIGNAKPGDKTMLDTLYASLMSVKKARAEGLPFPEVLKAMSQGAVNGCESTKDMVAKVGRASRLGERSKGVLDAGAVSCCLILRTLAEQMEELMS